MKYINLIIAIYFSFYLISCNKNDDLSPIEDSDLIPNIDSTLNRNTWVKDVMKEVYLWEEYIPEDLIPSNTENTFDFFDKFIYEDDYWSFISDDYYNTENMFNGISTTSGLVFYLQYVPNSTTIMGVVEYVLPNTPASEQNLKRGDIFTRIDGYLLNYDNYYDLVTKGGTYTISIDSLTSDNKTKYLRTITINEIQNYQENPVYLDTIYEIENKRIGYLVYNAFISSFDDNEINRVFKAFKDANITDLIMDLRYNSGGDVSSEENLANLIAPQSAIGEVFAVEVWNDLYNTYFSDEKEFGKDYLTTKIKAHENNINLTGKLIGITTSSTASASEGLLNGLKPLTNFTQIGKTTHGKYTGMVVIPDDKDNPEWALIPIVMKATNKEGISVKGGMWPDIIISDNPRDGYQLGDTKETMLSEAINVINDKVNEKSIKSDSPLRGETIKHFRGSNEIKVYPMIMDKKATHKKTQN